MLYAVLFDNSGKYSVAAIGSTTGTVIWETPMSSKVGSPVFGENGKLFVISSSNELISINQSTWSVLWSSVLVNQDDSNQITGSIMGKDKVLYCTLNEGKLISFDTLTRTVFWEGALLHKGPSKPVISNQGILYIGVQDSDTSYLRSLSAMQTPHSQTTPEYQPNSTFHLFQKLSAPHFLIDRDLNLYLPW
ncbi:MAG: hypothetical protein EBU27_06540 [Opitutae bacterium]|nr:hypothetical protein [Opitutae bacterium]